MARSPAARTQAAADALLDWLGERVGDPSRLPSEPLAPPSIRQATEPVDGDAVSPGTHVSRSLGRDATRRDTTPAVAPAHTDWLFHHLRVQGPPEIVAAFRKAAAGAGVIPWYLDLDRVEEDAFLRLAAPSGQPRTLSLEGARMLAAELRDAVARRHALAVARVGHSQACLFDLHALLPVPGDVLRLGPDHPSALQWLWTHWGTTEALRHVALAPDRGAAAASKAVFRISFWSADWTPWRAMAVVRGRFPELGFEVQPHYERA